MRKTLVTSSQEMLDFGHKLSCKIAPGDVISFSGDLGAGKTTLIKGLISGLTGCTTDLVNSPTFTYLQEYGNVVHFDLYRLADSSQFSGMGFDEYFSPEHICLIEWPERITSLLPSNSRQVHIEHTQDGRIVAEEIL